MAHSYRELIVWQKSIELVTFVYRLTKQFPKEEIYGLTSQIRRAAVSVPSNIAEGQGRLSKKDFRHFLGQARGSLLELETQLLIASNLGYMREPALKEFMERSGEVSRILHRLIEVMSEAESEPATRN
ncbi:MAG: four helix bundle protein [Acidobacteriia bacterium]|nr:four helix bundle protein [Terriglobia bacterium]